MSYHSTELAAAAALRDRVNVLWTSFGAIIDPAPVPERRELPDMLVTVTAETAEAGDDSESFLDMRFDTVPVHLVFRQAIPPSMAGMGEAFLDWLDEKIALVEQVRDNFFAHGKVINTANAIYSIESVKLNYSNDANALKSLALWIASITVTLKVDITIPEAAS